MLFRNIIYTLPFLLRHPVSPFISHQDSGLTTDQTPKNVEKYNESYSDQTKTQAQNLRNKMCKPTTLHIVAFTKLVSFRFVFIQVHEVLGLAYSKKTCGPRKKPGPTFH